MSTVLHYSFEPIGIVRSTRKETLDDDWDSESSYVELSSRFTEEALRGLANFSHVEIIFLMDRVDPKKNETAARHPRQNPDWPKVGIFAQRAKDRPNPIGLTIARLEKIVGLKLHVQGLDAIDGTPVLDVKPWVREFGPRGEVRQPNWITELMKEYWSRSR